VIHLCFHSRTVCANCALSVVSSLWQLEISFHLVPSLILEPILRLKFERMQIASPSDGPCTLSMQVNMRWYHTPILIRLHFVLCIISIRYINFFLWFLCEAPPIGGPRRLPSLPMPKAGSGTACFVVWRPRRAADPSTNRRQGFLCRRTASMEQVPIQLKLLRSTTTFRRQLKTFLFQSAYGHRETDWWLFSDAPSVFSAGRNTNDSVNVTLVSRIRYKTDT